MADKHPFTIQIDNAEGGGRYRWSIREDGKPRDQSTQSFATIREADADAIRALRKILAKWRMH